MTQGGEGAPQMSTWQHGGKTLNIAKSAVHPPMGPCEHSLRDASVRIRAPLSSILQENENSKKLYSALPTHEILSALMLTEILRGKSYHKPTCKTQLTVNSRNMQLISTPGISRNPFSYIWNREKITLRNSAKASFCKRQNIFLEIKTVYCYDLP